MAKFIIKTTATGTKFDLNINGHIVLTSQVYKSLDACKNGIDSVKKNAPLNKIDDLDVEGDEVTNPKFEVYTDNAGKFRFRLKASNGQIIATSEDFKAKEDWLKVVALVVKEASGAAIEEA